MFAKVGCPILLKIGQNETRVGGYFKKWDILYGRSLCELKTCLEFDPRRLGASDHRGTKKHMQVPQGNLKLDSVK